MKQGRQPLDKIFMLLTGASLALILLLLLGFIGLLLVNGLPAFWPGRVAQFELQDGTVHLGEIWNERTDNNGNAAVLIRRGNRDLYSTDFLWVERKEIASISFPPNLLVVERQEWGSAIGFRRQHNEMSLVLQDGAGNELVISNDEILRVIEPNQLSLPGRVGLYLTRIQEFLFTAPREANTEGGVWPAIFGTVMMVMVMSIAAVPLGVMAAIYLSEYAKSGPIVSIVRICVNNLAGVPSIVFGVFGVSFFIYMVGGSIDQLFFSDNLPAPTFGTGGLLWASLTLALLTVPTVIVATLEGLSAVPDSLRAASYALGATKFETVRNVVLPSLLPAIVTGTILAISRAAGEVAPLMMTGVVKLAPALPLDAEHPYLHLERKFMHLGFHIYDLGFQSPNVDSVRPIVYSTAVLLLLLVLTLNCLGILMRVRVRRRLLTEKV